MWGRRFRDRGDAHEAAQIQTQVVAAQSDQCIRVFRNDTGLLLFFARVDLNETGGTAAEGIDFGRNLSGKLRAVDGFDDVEETDGFLDLVGLEGADQMQTDIRKFLAQRRPTLHCFLHSVFPEDPVAGKTGGARQREEPIWSARL